MLLLQTVTHGTYCGIEQIRDIINYRSDADIRWQNGLLCFFRDIKFVLALSKKRFVTSLRESSSSIREGVLTTRGQFGAKNIYYGARRATQYTPSGLSGLTDFLVSGRRLITHEDEDTIQESSNNIAARYFFRFNASVNTVIQKRLQFFVPWICNESQGNGLA